MPHIIMIVGVILKRNVKIKMRKKVQKMDEKLKQSIIQKKHVKILQDLLAESTELNNEFR